MTAVTSWFGVDQATAIPPRDVARILAPAMRDIPMGGFPIAAEPVVVPRQAYLELLDANRRLLELSRTVVANLAPDQAGRMAALRVDPAQYRRGEADEEFELRHAIGVARADVVIGAEGPRFIEINLGAGVGGMVQFEQQSRAWQRIRAEAGEPPLTTAPVYAPLAALIRNTCAELGIAPGALLVGTATDSGKRGRYTERQTEILRELGVAATFVELPDVAAHVGDPRAVLGVVQYCEDEAITLGWDTGPLLAAISSGLRAVPTQTSRLVGSKKVLAMISEGLPWMSEEDRDLARRFVPWSRVLGDRQVTWAGEKHDLARLLLAEPERFVLKGAAGLSAQEVFFGARTSPEQWRALVEEGTRTRYYVAQELVDPVRVPVRVLLDETGQSETVMANPVVSPFCVGGVPAGCLLRFNTATEPGAVTVGTGAILGCLLGAPA